MIEHHIQKDILIRLSKAASLRFSELKPEELESNSFMYHLRQLQGQKLVDKTEDGYSLSSSGLAYIDGFSFHTLKPRKQPKLICILIVRNQDGEWLMARRKYQPYIDQYMLVSGKQHLGEAPQDHAQRELNEKLRMNIPLTRRGFADIRIYRDDMLITHVSAHLYVGDSTADSLPPSTDQFDFAWVKEKDSSVKFLAGTREIMEHVQSSENPVFLSLDVHDD